MLTDSEYRATICEQSVENIKHQAAQVAKRFQDLGISTEVTIIEEKATRMVSVPKKVFGITISGKEIAEQYSKVILSGWLLCEVIVLMGEDTKDNEWYKWTRYYYLGENGSIYSRYEEILEQHNNRLCPRSVNISIVVIIEMVEDIMTSDKLPKTGYDGLRIARFGDTLGFALKNLSNKFL